MSPGLSGTMADSLRERIKSFPVFMLRGLPLVRLCCMQIRSATSDPELVRHFFLNRGKKGTKAGAKITYIWKRRAIITFYTLTTSFVPRCVYTEDAARMSLCVQRWHQTQLTDTHTHTHTHTHTVEGRWKWKR